MFKQIREDVMRVFLALVFVLLAGPAVAATVNLDPIYHVANDFLQTILEGVAMAVSGWLMFIFHKYLTPWIGAQMEAKARDSLNTALDNGMRIAMTTVEGAEKAHNSAEVKGQLAAWAAQYAIDHAPDAVSRFGLDPNQLALKALAYIPPAPTSIDLTATAIAKPGAVEVRELPPIGESKP
jgi:hypothetical protein